MGIKTTYICDRCGKRSCGEKHSMREFSAFGPLEELSDFPGNGNFLLCPECCENFKLWISGKIMTVPIVKEASK